MHCPKLSFFHWTYGDKQKHCGWSAKYTDGAQGCTLYFKNAYYSLCYKIDKGEVIVPQKAHGIFRAITANFQS